jgi:putative inorganic carbon (HCO3(-)) transporter
MLWALLLLSATCLARTEALGAWLGLGAGLVTIVSLSPAIRRQGLILLGATALLGGLFLQRVGRLGEVASISEIGKVDRWMMWQAAAGMIRDRPVLGHGLNTFMANYLTYWVGGERQPRYAHNCYLQVAAETGLIGLVAFVGLLACLFQRLVAGIRQASPAERPILLGFLAGLLAFAVQAGVDTNFYSLRQAALFWVLAGLSLGLSQRVSRESHPCQ